MIKFLAGTEIVEAIKLNIKVVGPTDLAVAYWGRGSTSLLGLTKSHRSVRILCDLRSLSCNPYEIEKLLRCGFFLKTLNDLHAKVYLTGRKAVIGSANASTNGLGKEGQEINLELEAAVETDESSVTTKANKWFEDRWEEGDVIDKLLLKQVKQQWKSQVRFGLFAFLATNPMVFSELPISFAVFKDDPSDESKYEHAWEKVKKEYYTKDEVRKYDDNGYPIYLNPTGLKVSTGDYLINYWAVLDEKTDELKKLTSSGSVWRIKREVTVPDTNGKAIKVILAEEVSFVLGMKATQSEYKELTKVFRDYFAISRHKKYGDVLLDVKFRDLSSAHPRLFDGIRKWQTEKLTSKMKAGAEAGAP
jgi:PLD-like domain